MFRMYPRDAPKWGYHACWLTPDSASAREAGWPYRRLDELTPVLSENSRAAYVRRLVQRPALAASVGARQVQRLRGDVVEDHLLRERRIAKQPRLSP